MPINKVKNKKGFTLIELLIYIALLVVMLLFVVNSILSYTASYKQLTALRALDNAGVVSMERMTRDIRNASSASTTASIFNNSPGKLVIVQAAGGNSTTTKFYVQNSQLELDVNSVNIGPLTSSNIGVTNLVFMLSTSSVSQAIRIDMTLTATSSSIVRTKTFHSTIVMKGS
jgi:prepilin-type N-terminal cleavage/methylation domain-containing protein